MTDDRVVVSALVTQHWYAGLLSVHIVAGVLGLALGLLVVWPIGIRARGQGARTRVWRAYLWTVVVVCVSATVMVVVRRDDLWWLIPVSALTVALALCARRALSLSGIGWSHAYVHGLGGSYIALVTATIVVSFAVDGPLTGAVGQLLAWLGPTILITPLLEFWRRALVGADRVWPPMGAAIELDAVVAPTVLNGC